jgi:signal transduction histidine kinase
MQQPSIAWIDFSEEDRRKKIKVVANALRFTPEGGIVTIEAEARRQAVEVRVSDTGIGIPPEDRPHIFERSYRGDRARTLPRPGDRLGSGSGLGLAIVKGLVEAMEGAVDATSAPGEGTCVRFLLPLAEGCSSSQSV